MKKYFVLLSLIIVCSIQACPTCIGRINKKSPPFFSDEYYKPGSNNKQIKNNKKADKQNKQPQQHTNTATKKDVS